MNRQDKDAVSRVDTASVITQMVIFRLRPGVDAAAFIELSQAMHAWLQEQDGFCSYELYQGDAHWADRICWRDTDCATRGNHAFFETSIYQDMLQLVEPDYSAILGRRVL